MVNKLSTNSPISYFCFAFIAMAGLAYINFLPSVVNALAGGIGFNQTEAGQIVAANGYGGLIGSIVAIFLIHKVQWRPLLLILMALLAIIDFNSIFIDSYNTMIGWRFFAGVIGGLCVGIGFSVLARLPIPDRAFGTMLFIQFSIGSIAIYLLPELEALLNAHSVFILMASLALLSLIFLLFLPALPLAQKADKQTSATAKILGKPLLLLTAITLYQVAASAIWAYVGQIGLTAKFSEENVSIYIATTGLLGLFGAMLPVLTGNRFGRYSWIIAGTALSLIAALMLTLVKPYSNNIALIYISAMAILFFAWPAVLAYLLAIISDLDASGQLASIAAVVSSIGLATGPLLAASLLNGASYSPMLFSCALIFLFTALCLIKPIQAPKQYA